MKKKIVVILFCTLLIVATPGIAAHSIITKLQNQSESCDPLTPEPLPVEKVKEIPIPWQFWEEFPQEGVLDVIVLPINVSPVAIVRAYAVLHEEVPLEDLLWDNTMGMQFNMIDNPKEPYILEPGEQVEYFIPTTPYTAAVIMRYSVALAEEPNVVYGHFINEVLFEGRTIRGSLSNFDVHNDYPKPINNFELEIYGEIVPTDVIGWYDVPDRDPALVNASFGPVWYYGWGAPPEINSKSYGVELIWYGPPVKTCEWIHFGVSLKPGIKINYVKAYFTITKSKDKPDNYVHSFNMLFLQFYLKHQNLFTKIEKLLAMLGQ